MLHYKMLLWKSPWIVAVRVLVYCVYADPILSDVNIVEGETAQQQAVGRSIFLQNFIWPTEYLPPRSRNGRTAEWFRKNKDVTSIIADNSMTLQGSIEIGMILGSGYTVASLLPGNDGNVYILRKRESVNPFASDGRYQLENEGAIPVDCILLLNTGSVVVESSVGNNTFYYPSSMAQDSDGSFWVADSGRQQVLQIKSDNGEVNTSIGRFLSAGSGQDQLCKPNDVALTTKHVFIADGCNNRVVMYDKEGNFLRMFGEPASNVLTGMVNRNDLPLRYMKDPRALAVDAQTDRLFIGEGGYSRVLIVNAGEKNLSTFGTGIRSLHHREMEKVQSIALHKNKPVIFMLNSYNRVYLHRGFTFNTHDASFRGAWSNDERGFTRPQGLAVSDDGSLIYVADNPDETPEKIWIFVRAEDTMRARRNTFKGQLGVKNQLAYISSTKGPVSHMMQSFLARQSNKNFKMPTLEDLKLKGSFQTLNSLKGQTESKFVSSGSY